MKQLNDILFITEVARNISNYCNRITAIESYDNAKSIANFAIGHIDCCITYMNCMLSTENNDFTGMLDEVTGKWYSEVYQALIDTADRLGQGPDVIRSLCEKRDEFALD